MDIIKECNGLSLYVIRFNINIVHPSIGVSPMYMSGNSEMDVLYKFIMMFKDSKTNAYPSNTSVEKICDFDEIKF